MSDISISIKSSGDTKYELTISPSITILDLKNLVAEKSSIPADRQRLIYSGKVLKDGETVESYKVQSGHTIHMVKSAAKPAEPAAAPLASSAPSEASGVPSNIAAGQGAFNPLADLTSARYAGYTQLPDASMFGPDGGMHNAMPNPDQMAELMSSPMFAESMNAMLDNPQMLDALINLNPQLRALGPQLRQMLQSPFVRQMLTNPELMRSMMQMQQGQGGPTSAFPEPGANPTVQGNNDSSEGNNSASGSTADASNPYAALLGGNPFAFLGGAGNQGAPAAPADNRPPEERYESQLRQLNDMGFFEFDRNIEALRRTGGSVQGAIEYLLGGN